MRSATRVTVSTFGALAGLAGLEHGVGEIRQGNVRLDGVVIQSWPGLELFEALSGEPAMTLVPNLLLSGSLAVLASLAFLVWATLLVERRHGGLVLLLLSLVMLLVGAGFGPPLLGILLGLTATRLGRRSFGPRPQPALHPRGWLAALWPWAFAAALAAWLWLMPGLLLLDHFLGVDNAALTSLTALAAFGLLGLTIAAARARDTQPPARPYSRMALSG